MRKPLIPKKTLTPSAPNRVRCSSASFGATPPGSKRSLVECATITPTIATARQPSSVGRNPKGCLALSTVAAACNINVILGTGT